MTKEAELTNGRLAMIGFNILIINYVWFRCSNRCVRYNRTNHSRHILMAKQIKNEERISDRTQKLWAEKWNGRLAMLGLIAAATSDVLTGHMFFGQF